MIKKHNLFRDELQNLYTELQKLTDLNIDQYHAQVVLTRPWVRLVLGQNSIGVIVPAVTHDSCRNISLQNIRYNKYYKNNYYNNSSLWGLNPRPFAYKANALPLS